jgi:transposase-like protein
VGSVANFAVIQVWHEATSVSGDDDMFKGRHFDRSVILLCVRWYLAYALSLRDLKEMMAERGISVDHTTIHRWVVHFSPVLLKRFNRRKRSVGSKWHMDETYIKVHGQWMYLYRAIDSVGDTVEFWFSEHRDLPAARRFLRKALERHGRPGRIVVDGSQTNREAIISCDAENRLRDRSQRVLKAIRIRNSKYLTDVFDKGRSAPMSCKRALRCTVPAGGRDSVARSKIRAGREAIARYARLGLDGASTSLSFAATDGTAKLILLLCRGSGDRVAKSRVEVATLSRSL